MTNKELYALRKSEHRCTRCGAVDARTLSGRIYCAECTEKRKRSDSEYRHEGLEYQKKLRAVRKAEGLCIECGREDAFTMAGRSRCADCIERARASDRRRYQKNGNDRNKQFYEKRAERGLCVKCGKRPAPAGRRLCDFCIAKTTENARERRIKSGMNWPRGSNGVCWICNKAPVIPGKKLCPTCYEKTLAAQEKATQWHKENGNGPAQKGVENFWTLFKAEKQARRRKTTTTSTAASNPKSGA